MKLIIILCCLIFPSYSFALTLNKSQTKLVKIAVEEGKKIDQGYIIAGIMMQESHAGKLGRIGDDNKSFGICQMQLKTAQEVIRKHFKRKLYTDKQLKNKLVTDDKFAILLCRIYFSQLLDYFHGDTNKAILSYNIGYGNFNKYGFAFDPNNYLKKVKKYSKILKTINNKDK